MSPTKGVWKMIGSWWYEESEKNWDTAVLAEVNTTWQYDMLGGMTNEFRHCVCVQFRIV